MKKNKIPKPRKGAWFVSVRSSYLPASWQGWLLYVPYMILIVLGLLWVSNMLNNCSASGACGVGAMTSTIFFSTLFLVPYYALLVFIMHWIAKQKS